MTDSPQWGCGLPNTAANGAANARNLYGYNYMPDAKLPYMDDDWPTHPSTGAQLTMEARRGDTKKAQPVTLDLEFADQGGEGATPYEVLLQAAIEGDSARFKRQDAVEENWRIMQPLVDSPPPVHGYAPGSWGPEEANKLLAGHGRWHGPWVTP